MEQSHSPSGENDEGGWRQRLWRSMSPSKDQKESRSADGREEAEMFQERATYTTQGEDKDGKAQTDNAYAKAQGKNRWTINHLRYQFEPSFRSPKTLVIHDGPHPVLILLPHHSQGHAVRTLLRRDALEGSKCV